MLQNQTSKATTLSTAGTESLCHTPYVNAASNVIIILGRSYSKEKNDRNSSTIVSLTQDGSTNNNYNNSRGKEAQTNTGSCHQKKQSISTLAACPCRHDGTLDPTRVGETTGVHNVFIFNDWSGYLSDPAETVTIEDVWLSHYLSPQCTCFDNGKNARSF